MLDFCTVLIDSASPCNMLGDQGMCPQHRFSDHHETMLQPHPPTQPLHTITTTIPPQCAHLVCLGILEPTSEHWVPQFAAIRGRSSGLVPGSPYDDFRTMLLFTKGWKLMESSRNQHEQLFWKNAPWRWWDRLSALWESHFLGKCLVSKTHLTISYRSKWWSHWKMFYPLPLRSWFFFHLMN